MQGQGCSTQTLSGALEHWHTLVELEDTLTILKIYQLSCLTIEDEHLTHVYSHLWITCTHLLSSILCMITFINATSTQESQESKLFQPVLQAYCMHHSWIITAHVSLGNMEKQWRIIIREVDRTQQLLKSLLQKPLAPIHLLSPLEAELNNLDSIHISYKPLI